MAKEPETAAKVEDKSEDKAETKAEDRTPGKAPHKSPVKEPGPKKRPYILKQGQKHFESTKDGNVRLEGGQKAYLTDAQFSAFKDKFDPAEETKQEIEKRAEVEATEKFSVKHVGGRKYNVVNNETEKILNDEPLSGPVAKKLQAKLEAGKS